jgi:hypothetical protein
VPVAGCASLLYCFSDRGGACAPLPASQSVQSRPHRQQRGPWPRAPAAPSHARRRCPSLGQDPGGVGRSIAHIICQPLLRPARTYRPPSASSDTRAAALTTPLLHPCMPRHPSFHSWPDWTGSPYCKLPCMDPACRAPPCSRLGQQAAPTAPRKPLVLAALRVAATASWVARHRVCCAAAAPAARSPPSC